MSPIWISGAAKSTGKLARGVCVLIAAFATASALAESGTLLRATDLKQKPFIDAASAGQLPANTKLDILSRKGAWMEIKSGDLSGWVKLLNVRTGNGKANSGGSDIGALANVVTTGSSGTTVTTGVKGVSKENLERSVPDYKEVEKLDKLAVSEQDAIRAAKQVKLSSVQVPAIDLPSSFSSSSSPDSGGGTSIDNLHKRR